MTEASTRMLILAGLSGGIVRRRAAANIDLANSSSMSLDRMYLPNTPKLISNTSSELCSSSVMNSSPSDSEIASSNTSLALSMSPVSSTSCTLWCRVCIYGSMCGLYVCGSSVSPSSHQPCSRTSIEVRYHWVVATASGELPPR